MKNESCEKDNKQRDATEEGVVSSSKESLEGMRQNSGVETVFSFRSKIQLCIKK